MNILGLIAGFGGGMIGAYMGAIPAFILTGIVVLVGSIIAMSGGSSFIIDFIAFGPCLGPHVAFAGGVAATAYVAKKEGIGEGKNITYALGGLSNPKTLIVGGIFGVLGYLVHYLLGNILYLNTDLPACTVVISGIVARFIFGRTGLWGNFPKGQKRAFFSSRQVILCNMSLSLGIGIATGFIYEIIIQAGISGIIISYYPLICFSIAAISLVFVQMGGVIPTTHHIALISALAVTVSGMPAVGIIFGIVATMFEGFIETVFNNRYCDSHIDSPAFTICVLTLVINMVFAS